jgi:soluble P-type ATPase
MIEVDIPGYGQLELHYIVLDYNGTLAVDGEIIGGVREQLTRLAEKLEVHVLTADTFGLAAANLEGVPCRLTVLGKEAQDVGKRDFVGRLGRERTVSVGNGRNDQMMLRESALGLAVILAEGACMATVSAADIVFSDILDALKILESPLRLTATLRS